MRHNALPADDLSGVAAAAADLSLIVRGRFVEAADTMVHLDVGGVRPALPRTLWPDIRPEAGDDAGQRRRYRPDAAAISRAEEVLQDWLLAHVRDQERRVLLLRWSVCLAAPQIAGSFRDFCSKTGRVRRTAERRLQAGLMTLTESLLAIGRSPAEPDWSRISPMMPNRSSNHDRTGVPPVKHGHHWRAEDAGQPFDPDSPMLAELAKRLERGNRRRAKMRQE
jgi:hypothetical protein